MRFDFRFKRSTRPSNLPTPERGFDLRSTAPSSRRRWEQFSCAARRGEANSHGGAEGVPSHQSPPRRRQTRPRAHAQRGRRRLIAAIRTGPRVQPRRRGAPRVLLGVYLGRRGRVCTPNAPGRFRLAGAVPSFRRRRRERLAARLPFSLSRISDRDADAASASTRTEGRSGERARDGKPGGLFKITSWCVETRFRTASSCQGSAPRV